MANDTVPWTLTIPSDLRLLALARAFVEAFCQVGGVDEELVNAVVLATDEATNNIMRHAHQGNETVPLQIQCFLFPDRIEVRLLDHGPPFDLDTVPHLDPGEVRVGGRGVFLMRRLMDELTVQPRGPGAGNELRLVKFRPPRSPRS